MTNKHIAPVQLWWRVEGQDEYQEMDEGNPLPVQILPGEKVESDFRSALVATVVSGKPAGGRLLAVYVTNPNTVSEWVQFFDKGASEVVLGTTVPKFSLGVPKGASATDVGAMEWTVGVDFDHAISYAATTTPTGNTAPTTGLTANFFFR